MTKFSIVFPMERSVTIDVYSSDSVGKRHPFLWLESTLLWIAQSRGLAPPTGLKIGRQARDLPVEVVFVSLKDRFSAGTFPSIL